MFQTGGEREEEEYRKKTRTYFPDGFPLTIIPFLEFPQTIFAFISLAELRDRTMPN